MTGRDVALARARCESLQRISRDWAAAATSLGSDGLERSVRDLTNPPSIKKTVRTAGVALAVAPEPFTTVAGLALVAGSFAMKNEPTTLKSITEELGIQLSGISDFDLAGLTISV